MPENGEKDLTGFTLVTDTTEASGVSYTISFPQVDPDLTIDEQYAVVTEALGGKEGIVASYNSDNKQSATQGAKAQVREAIGEAIESGRTVEQVQAAIDSEEADGEAEEAVLKAIESHRKTAAQTVKGPGRKTSGLTKTSKRRAGEALDDDVIWDMLVEKHGEPRARQIIEGNA